MVFTRSEVIKKARLEYRKNQEEWSEFIKKHEQELYRELDHLGTQFFRMAKQDKNPEKQFITLTGAGAMLSDIEKQPEYTQLACDLLSNAARQLCREKMALLNEAVRS